MQRRLSIVVVVALLPLAACGARWDSAQRAQMRRRVQTVAQSGGAATDTGTAADDTSADNADSPTGVDTASGSAASAAGPRSGAGSSGVSAASKKLPCAAPSKEVGVTDTTLNIGSISSLTGPVPGLGASAAGAVRAYVAYRNATGGVCGRKIALKEADDGTDNGQYRSIITGYASQVFGVAGGFALGDVGGVDVIRQTRIPLVYLPGQHASSSLPTVFDLNPDFDNPNSLIGKYKYLHDHGGTKASVTYLAVDQSRQEAQIQENLIKAAGIQIVQIQELPLSTLSFDAAARSVANSGANYMLFIGSVDANQSMARSLQDTGYKDLKFPEYFVFAYGTNFIQATGSAGEGATTWLRSLPIEEASSNKELATFLQWLGRSAPGVDKDNFAEDSWAASKAFFDTLEALNGPITREAFITQLGSVDTFDSGGMYGPIRLGKKRTNGCAIGMQVQNGKWVRMFPSTGYTCLV